MKVEEIQNRSKEAVEHPVGALEAGQSEVLTQYLSVMASFMTTASYVVGNIVQIMLSKT